METKLLINQAFHIDLFEKIEKAKKHIELQFMTFEGDAVGWRLAHLLKKKVAQGVRVRVIIDYCSDFRARDAFAHRPSRWPRIRETKRMIVAMRQGGVKVRRTNPPGFLYVKFMVRNHKKLAIIDDACYLGGINISEHNFEWHDFMVRLNGRATALALADFEATWQEKENYSRGNFIVEKDLGTAIRNLISSARSEIVLSSTYFLDLVTARMLARKAEQGVKVTVLTVRRNNLIFLRLVTPYLFRILLRSGVEIYYYDRFSHAKYLIIDRQKVLFGSSNFGYESYKTKDELCMLSEEPGLVQSFLAELYEVDMQSAYRARQMNGIPRPIASFLNRGFIVVVRCYSLLR